MAYSRVLNALLDASGVIPQLRNVATAAMPFSTPVNHNAETFSEASASWFGEVVEEIVCDRYIIGTVILIGYFMVVDMARCCRARRLARSLRVRQT